ncbi:hypothetical protein BJV82DRAFT_665961 [Fennellomyces sp. T-0311]|nr:hypothetical protein BJV82DRAFT_665961 [Fennellomyces sp. T-0311]
MDRITVDYSRHLKAVENFDRHFPLGQPDQEEFMPFDRPPRKPSPHHCQSIHLFGAQDRRIHKHLYAKVTIPPDHPIFTSGRSLIAPISQKIGIPVLIYLESPLAHPSLRSNCNDYANLMISNLLVNPRTGRTNIVHRDGLGTALLARLDYQPLSIELLTIIHAYITMLVDERYNLSELTDHALVQSTITPDDFTKFSREFNSSARKDFHVVWDMKF